MDSSPQVSGKPVQAPAGLKMQAHGNASSTEPSSLDATARMLWSLDANRDGRVDSQEVVAIATGQGLDPKASSQEFASLDSNGDGTFNATELAGALSDPTSSR